MQRVDASGRLGAWSDLRAFHVSGSKPVLKAPSDATTVEPRGALFEWDDDPTAASAVRYRWAAVNGTTRVTQDTSAKAFAPTSRLNDGTWTWTVTALDGSGRELGTSAPRTFSVSGTPHATVTLEGAGQVGTSLNVAPFNWDVPEVTTTFQWYRGSSLIAGATSRLYTVTSADFGKELWVRATGTKEGYDPGTADSARQTPSEGAALVNTVIPTVTGTRAVGNQLVADPGAWTPSGTPAFTYQWLRNGVAITGATRSTYPVNGSRCRPKPHGPGDRQADRTRTRHCDVGERRDRAG